MSTCGDLKSEFWKKTKTSRVLVVTLWHAVAFHAFIKKNVKKFKYFQFFHFFIFFDLRWPQVEQKPPCDASVASRRKSTCLTTQTCTSNIYRYLQGMELYGKLRVAVLQTTIPASTPCPRGLWMYGNLPLSLSLSCSLARSLSLGLFLSLPFSVSCARCLCMCISLSIGRCVVCPGGLWTWADINAYMHRFVG